MSLSPDFDILPTRLHDALLTLPVDKATCASYMITIGGLSLSQNVVERAIDLIVEDLFNLIILDEQTYASLLAKHQGANAVGALRALRTSGAIIRLTKEAESLQALVDDSTAEYMGLSGAQRSAIANIKAVADEGIIRLQAQITEYTNATSQLDSRRNLS